MTYCSEEYFCKAKSMHVQKAQVPAKEGMFLLGSTARSAAGSGPLSDYSSEIRKRWNAMYVLVNAKNEQLIVQSVPGVCL